MAGRRRRTRRPTKDWTARNRDNFVKRKALLGQEERLLAALERLAPRLEKAERQRADCEAQGDFSSAAYSRAKDLTYLEEALVEHLIVCQDAQQRWLSELTEATGEAEEQGAFGVIDIAPESDEPPSSPRTRQAVADRDRYDAILDRILDGDEGALDDWQELLGRED